LISGVSGFILAHFISACTVYKLRQVLLLGSGIMEETIEMMPKLHLLLAYKSKHRANQLYLLLRSALGSTNTQVDTSATRAEHYEIRNYAYNDQYNKVSHRSKHNQIYLEMSGQWYSFNRIGLYKQFKWCSVC
jgi:hypothetical protein